MRCYKLESEFLNPEMQNGKDVINVAKHKTSKQYRPKPLVLYEEIYGALMHFAAYRLEKEQEYLICYQNGKKLDSHFMVRIREAYSNVHDVPCKLKPNNVRVSYTTRVHATRSAEDQSRIARPHMHSQRTQKFNYVARMAAVEVVANQ